MSETCPKCGIKMPTGMCQWHLIDGDDCLRNQLTAAQARIADLEFANSELLKDAEAGQELMDTRDDEQQKELRKLYARIAELEAFCEVAADSICGDTGEHLVSVILTRAEIERLDAIVRSIPATNSGPAAEGA